MFTYLSVSFCNVNVINIKGKLYIAWIKHWEINIGKPYHDKKLNPMSMTELSFDRTVMNGIKNTI